MLNKLQLPYVAVIALVMVLIASLGTGALGSPFVPVGIGFLAAATVVAIAMDRSGYTGGWQLAVPLADIVVIAFLREPVYATLPGVSIAALVPIFWISWQFRARAIPAAIAGAALVTALPFIVVQSAPADSVELANVVGLPAAMTLFAIFVNLTSRRVRLGDERVRANDLELRGALRVANDRDILNSAIFETVEAAMAFFDPDKRALRVNDRALVLAELAGIGEPGPEPRPPRVFEADRATPTPIDERGIPRELRTDLPSGRLYWVGPQGDQVAVIATSKTVYREDGEILGTIIAAHDVTKLANAVSVREAFLSTVSHELRTPLTSVIGYLELIEDALDADAVGITSAVATAQRNANVLLERIAELISASDSTLALDRSETDVTGEVNRIVADAQGSARSSGVVLASLIEEAVLARIDGRHFDRLIANLLSNALKYTPPGGRVDVALTRRAGGFVLSVSDTGVGMSLEEQRQAFDRFFRAPSARTGAVQGLGIGLSMVKAIVDAHGGTLDLASTPGFGTVVRVSLPDGNEASLEDGMARAG